MTPAEVWRDLAARRKREQEERERQVWLAWHTAAWMRSKTLPSLNEVLGRNRTRTLSKAQAEERKAEHDELTKRMLNVGRKPG